MPYSLASSGLLIFTKAIPCQSNNIISITFCWLVTAAAGSVFVVVGMRFSIFGRRRMTRDGAGRDGTGGGETRTEL